MKNQKTKEFYGWIERKLKGNIAETLVQHMLEYSGYKVYRFGYERTIDQIKDIKVDNGKEKKKITYMPDFIVIGKKGDLHFIEVKYRAKGLFHSKDINKLKNLSNTWPDARIIIVSLNKPCFKISRIKEFNETGKLYNLEDDKFIKVNKDLIEKYEKLVNKYYKN